MKKHLTIYMEGRLNDGDFNFYSQAGAYKFDINAVYKNGDSVHVDIEAEGTEDNLNNYVEYLKLGPLKKFIYLFRVEEGKYEGIKGFKSLKVHKDEFTFMDKLKKVFSKKQQCY